MNKAIVAVIGLSAGMCFGQAEVVCPGACTNHLQGVATDDTGNIYWSFTTDLVKTDGQGALLARVGTPSHYGDLTWHDGKVYVAVNLGKFNEEVGAADSWVYVHDAQTLAILARHEVPEAVHGAGGMEWHDGRFFVVGGLPSTHTCNYVYEYTETFRFVRWHEIASGQTLKGIQTACRAGDGTWWFGCYGQPAVTLVTNDAFELKAKKIYNSAVGIARSRNDGVLLIGKDRLVGKMHVGSATRASAALILSARDAPKDAR